MTDYNFVVQRALAKAEAFVKFNKGELVKVSHFIHAILTDTKKNLVTEAMEQLNVDLNMLVASILDFIESSNSKNKQTKKKVSLDDELLSILNKAKLLREVTEDDKINESEVFLIFLKNTNELSQLFLDFSIEHLTFSEVLTELSFEEYQITITNFNDINEIDNNFFYEPIKPEKPKKKKAVEELEYVKKYCTNFNEKVSKYKFNPCYSREDEINNLYSILLKRKKRNAIITGREGVGKTNLIEGLAYNIINKKSPIQLQQKTIYNLNINSLLAGTKYRGMFEERINGILEELSSNNDVILFVDEIHMMMSAGKTEGSSNMGDIIKPYITEDKLQLIGATTTREYKQIIEKDKAFKRRFTNIVLSEPSKSTTFNILKNIKKVYEKNHNVFYDDNVLKYCIELCDKYLPYRTFPDKAIDIIDEVGVYKLLSNSKSEKYNKLEKTYEQLENLKRQMIESGDYTNAKKIKKQSLEAYRDFKYERMKNQNKSKKVINKITLEDVANIIEKHTKIPIGNGGYDLEHLSKSLYNKVKGQDEAIENIIKALKINKFNLDDYEKPIGSFLFVGHSGVGKTELTKTLATSIFNDKNLLFRIDCSEFSQSHDISKLIGAPSGYVGYEQGGILTEYVKQKPFSVILFDEIEKAHGKLFDLLLQIMGEGRLTDNFGEVINFKNTIIILTSNIGNKKLLDQRVKIGYGEQKPSTNKDLIKNTVIKFFKPEFIGRLDSIVHFKPLSDKILKQLVIKEFEMLSNKVKKHNCELKISSSVASFLIKGYNEPHLGFRPLKIKISKLLKSKIADKLIDGANRIEVKIKSGKITVE